MSEFNSMRKKSSCRQFMIIKISVTCIFCLIQILTFSQWPTFNQAHPVSCQEPPFNYLAQGYLANIFIVDTTPNFYDGYIVFGEGILCNPDSSSNYRRGFSYKTNNSGEVMFWNRYDNDTIDLNENWFYYYSPSHGGMCLNHLNEIVSIHTTSVGWGEIAEEINYLVGINKFGYLLWKFVINEGPDRFGFCQVIENLEDSTYMSAGWYQDSSSVQTNQQASGSLMKIGPLGNIIWHKEYNQVANIRNVTKSSDNGYWLTGYTPNIGECCDGWYLNSDVVVLKVDSDGNEEGRLVFGGQCSGEAAQVFEKSNGEILLLGRLTNEEYVNPPFMGYMFSAIIQQAESGSLIEVGPQKNYLQTQQGDFTLALNTSDDGYLMVSDNVIIIYPEQMPVFKQRVGTILKINAERDSVWSHYYTYYDSPPPNQSYASASHFITDAKLTSGDGIVCCGYINQGYNDPNPLLATPWIFKVDSMGCLEPGCQYANVEEIVVGLENTITIFPNPATDVVNLSFTFPENYIPNNQNEIVIIDMQGREVLRENIFLFASSSNTIEINISSLSSGMYTLHWLSNSAWLDSSKIVVE